MRMLLSRRRLYRCLNTRRSKTLDSDLEQIRVVCGSLKKTNHLFRDNLSNVLEKSKRE